MLKFAQLPWLLCEVLKRTKDILFRPFSLKVWLKLLLIAILAGAVGGGINLNVPAGNTKESLRSDTDIVDFPAPVAPDSSDRQNGPSDIIDSMPMVFLVSAAVGGLVAVGFLILFTWISARFRFIFLDAVIGKSPKIRAGWKKFRAAGNGYFRLMLLFLAYFMLCFLASVAVALWLLYSSGAFSGNFDAASLVIIVTCVLGYGAFAIPAAVLFHYCDQFLVPEMAWSEASWRTSLCNLWAKVKLKKGSFLLYLPLAIAVGIGGAFALGFLILAVILIVGLLGLLLLGVPYFIFGWSAGYALYLAVVGIPLLLVLFAAMMIVQVPIPVFFRSFSLHYLCAVVPEYQNNLVKN